ncbi:ATP-dependent DNA helicase PIF1-like isoform X1 [Ptychodera flava]|uniref:ATP-dependent DNA helicase PIF1-like isoform X1 n=1 Tax=Ptychodera flava TaxID=63121 RepID=UPI003969D880
MEISAQDKVASLAIGGHNVFFTGAAGTGKTTLVKKLSSLLTQKTAVTSTTGISSSLYENSKTIHSFAGIRDARGNPEAILEHISEQSSVVARWRETDTLIIDEMSMLSRRTFELLNFVGQKMRNNASPFGGLQVIGCGDFLQLPPVPSHYDNGDFCFTSPLWNTVFPHTVVLDEVFRQRDQAFVDTLHCVAWGDLSGGTVEQLSQLTTPLNPADHGLQYIPRIYAQNLDVDYYNMDKLHHLDGHTHMKHYKAEDSGSKKLLNESLVVQEHLYLKVNAPVMLLYNLTDSLKNGMTGTVTGFSDSGYPVVHFPQVGTEEVISPRLWTVPSPDNTNKVLASRRQVPLKLSWPLQCISLKG